MTDEDRTDFAFDCEHAAKMLVERQQFPTMFVLRCHNGTMIPIGGIAHLDRPTAYRMLRILAIAHDAASVTMMSEAWMLKGTPEQLKGAKPSESERRIEILCVMVVTREAVLSSAREILRDSRGTITGLGDAIRIWDRGAAGGDLTRILTPERPSPAVQAAALDMLKAAGIEAVPMPRVH